MRLQPLLERFGLFLWPPSKKLLRKILANLFLAILNVKESLVMANAVNVNFKLDADIKKSMEAVCSEIGISMSTAFTVFAKKVSRERRIPFELSADPFYSESNIKYLEQKMADYKAGKLRFSEHELIEE